MNNLDKEIYRILYEAGSRGLTVRKIALHVHNACNTLFSSTDYNETHGYVLKFLIKSSKKSNSMIKRVEGRRRYFINTNSELTSQLLLDFREGSDKSVSLKTDKEPEDLSLSLF